MENIAVLRAGLNTINGWGWKDSREQSLFEQEEGN